MLIHFGYKLDVYEVGNPVGMVLDSDTIVVIARDRVGMTLLFLVHTHGNCFSDNITTDVSSGNLK